MTTVARLTRNFHRSPASEPMRLVRAQTADEIDGLEAAWPALDSVGAPSTHFGWMRAALGAFDAGAMPQITGLARGDKLLAAMPLVLKRVRGVQRLCPLGADRLHQPVDLASRDDAAAARLAARIARAGIPICLPRVPAESRWLEAFVRACRGRAIVATRSATAWPCIELDESWAEPERHLGASERRAFHEKRQFAERLGPVTTEIHTPALHELPELIDTVFRLAGSEPAAETSLAAEADRTVFWRQYAEAACVEGCLRVSLLRIGNRVAAAQLAVESAGACWILLSGADDRFAACSPHELLERETIRYAAEAALTSLEFWGGAPSCGESWATGRRRCVSLRAYPLNPAGVAALAVDLAAGAWSWWRNRRLIRRARPVAGPAAEA